MNRNFIHDVIKILFIHEGYLPNYPYHLISDKEMFDAFISDDGTGFFCDYYPLPDESLKSAYNKLVEEIKYNINIAVISEDNSYELPNWIYSYMLKQVISTNSSEYDIHDILVLMNLDNIDDVFTKEASMCCYEISSKWVKKLPQSQQIHRPPTIFGEPHVIKALRLQDTKVGK